MIFKWMLKNKKFMIVALASVIIIATYKILFLGYPFTFGTSITNIEQVQNMLESVGHFKIPNGYVRKLVTQGIKGENVLLIVSNEKTFQRLMVVRLREHLWDKLDKIIFIQKSSVESTWQGVSMGHPMVPSFKFTYWLPFYFRKDDLSGMGNEAIIKGMNVKMQERYQTSYADIYYVKGEFSKIGLYKEKKGIWNYPIPVLDFETLQEGALALVKSKKSGKVTICVSVNHFGEFQETDFKQFLQSFDPA